MHYEGGCLCGQVRYKAEGEPYNQTICHCTMCRKASGSASVAWVSFKNSEVSIGRKVRWFRSSGKAERGFCPTCGGCMFFRPLDVDEIDISTATLDNPELPELHPKDHLHLGTRISWHPVHEDKPQYKAHRGS